MTGPVTTGPIYLVATERSGSNFLRKSIADRQSDVCCSIPPAHFLRTFNFWSHCLGPFDDDTTWLRLITFYKRSTQERPVPWAHREDIEHIASSYHDRYGDRRDPVRLADHFYTLYAQKEGFETYLCKDIWLHHFALEIALALPDARFIHLVRDPRDVAASQKSRPFGGQNVQHLTRDWKDQTDQMMRLVQDTVLSERSLRIRYEDLIADQDGVISDLLATLSLSEAAGAGTKGTAIPTHFHEWKNLDKPVMTGNAGKFRSVLSAREVDMAEAEAWHTMQALGYTPQASQRPTPHVLALQTYAFVAMIKQRARTALNRYKLRSEPIDRRASRKLVEELEQDFR